MCRMSTAHFRITYDGPALDSHEMDVRDLAPSLLAVADLCEAAGQAIYGRSSKMAVNVRASFRTGSFGVDLSVGQNALQHVMAWLSGPDGVAMANGAAILGALGISGGGLIGLLKLLRGRKIKQVEVEGDKKRILTEDGERLLVETLVLTLLQDRPVRENLARALSPLDRDGISRVAFGDDESVREIVEKEDRPFFTPPLAQDELLFSNERIQAFSIVSLAFKEDNKWRLNDGQATIHVTIEDHTFLERVNSNIETFAKADVLICRVLVTQWQTEAGVRTEYVVQEVLDHKDTARQIPMNLS